MKVSIQGGFTLIEAMVGMAIIAIAVGGIAAVFPLHIQISESETTAVETSAAAQSIKDAIITGAKENYNPNSNSFYFVCEGVVVMVVLPQIGTQTTFPGDRDDELRKQGQPDSVALGLYPMGLLYKGEVMEVYRVSKSDSGAFPIQIRFLVNEGSGTWTNSFIGPSFDEDVNLNGTLDTAEDMNRSSFLDTFEDVGLDGIRDELETGYHPLNNIDPANDNFDPIKNPYGTERNGRFDAAEPFTDLNNNGIRDSLEPFTDVILNGRFDGETDLNNNGYLEVPDRFKISSGASTYLHDPSSRLTNYGYTISLFREMNDSGGVPFAFEVSVYKDFFKVRPSLQSARQDALDAAAQREINTSNFLDDDGDGVIDDTIITDADNKIIGMPAAVPESVLNGVDDDTDGVADDGLVKPDFVEKFQMIF